MDVIKEGIEKFAPMILKADRQSEEDASWAILTTDTKPRSGSRSRDCNGKDSYNWRYVQRFSE